MTGCLPACQPRYMKLVRNIFPEDSSSGLVKDNMDKLTFYVMKNSNKLDRIGKCLARRLNRDITRRRFGYVVIAMEAAVDILLVTCHGKSVNLFVESFLKMVQKLLECSYPDMQCLAASAFVKFSNIEEDMPSYDRRYDFFISIFCSLCYNADENGETRERVRVAGLHGLQGVVRKTVFDELQCNIWDPTHMNKIIPSLLVNLEDDTWNAGTEAESPEDEDTPARVAEAVLRELAFRASFGNINDVIRPVLWHLDNNNLWVSSILASRYFQLIMNSVQAQYGYAVVQMLMNHLDTSSESEADVRTSIVKVLSEIVLIAAEGSIGPSVLDVFNSLLRHLRLSAELTPRTESVSDLDRSSTGDQVDAAGALTTGEHVSKEQCFQEAVITAIGEFAGNLPDYQKIEVMMFVMNKMSLPLTDSTSSLHVAAGEWQVILLKSLLQVANRYKTILMMNAFPPAFLEPLLNASQSSDLRIQHIVHEIIHALVDRHDNRNKLQKIRIDDDVCELDLVIEKPPRQDISFIRKNGLLFYSHIYANLQQPENVTSNVEVIYTTLALLLIEFGVDDVLLDHIRLALEIQSLANKSSYARNACALHALVAAHLNLAVQLANSPALRDCVKKVIKLRQVKVPQTLPEIAISQTEICAWPSQPGADEESWLFSVDLISKALASSDFDVSPLEIPLVNQSLEFALSVQDRLSQSDVHSLFMDTDSVASFQSNSQLKVSVNSLKQMLQYDPEAEELEQEHQQKIFELFRSGPFEEIVARAEAKADKLRDCLNEILDVVATSEEESSQLPLLSDTVDTETDQRHLSASSSSGFSEPPLYNTSFLPMFVH